MSILKSLMKNRLFVAGLFIPLIFQLIYLCIAIPAIKDGSTGISNLKIAIVNEDQAVGKDVAAKLQEVLPFKTSAEPVLTGSLEAMDNGDFNMVVYIAPDFTAKLQQDQAQISYYINQSAPSMTKQAMERTAASINQTLNENSFSIIKDTIKSNSLAALGQTGLPANISAQINANLSKAFDALRYTSISSDIQKVNNTDGFAQTVLPFFFFLTYFVGCAIMTVLHTSAYNSVRSLYSKGKIFLTQQLVNIVAALVIPCVAIGITAAFGISFTLGGGISWLLLSIGFFTLLSMLQMFNNWFAIPGMGAAIVILFPLQLVTSGLIYSPEILPSFYTSIDSILPSTYLCRGMIRMFYGGPSISRDIGILLLMAAIFVAVSAFSLLKKGKAEETAKNSLIA